MRQIHEELMSGLRGLLRSPGFALTAIAVLALGIGANTAVFSVVDTLLLTPPPFERPQDLVVFTTRNDDDPRMFPGVSWLDWQDYRSASRELDDIAYFSWTVGYDLSGGDRAERVTGAWVSHNLFTLLGTRPLLGRTFTEVEDQPGARRVVVLSRSLWDTRFGSDRSVLGRTLTLDGEPFEILGVMPGDFALGPPAALWLPVSAVMPAGRRSDRSARARMTAIGRLAEGVDVVRADGELERIAANLAAGHPQTNAGVTARLVPFDRWNTGEVAGPARVLMGVVAVVLLIACANLANLLLARTPARRREMAIRASIGASRYRLVRMLLVENLALAGVAGGCGLLLAVWAIGLINGFGAAGLNAGRAVEFAIDARVLAFTAALSIATALLFGTGPALRLSRVSLQDVLRQGSASAGTSRLRSALVVAEIALAMVLLGAAGMLLRSLATFRSIDLGFDAASTITFRTELPEYRYSEPVAATGFMNEVLTGLRRDPLIRNAAAEVRVGDYGSAIVPADVDAPLDAETPPLAAFAVSDDYLETRGFTLLRGRALAETDRAGTEPVAVINEGMARHYWPDQPAIGRAFRLGDGDASRWYTVVGIVADVRQPAHTELTIVPHSVYLPIAQNPGRSLMFYARTRGEPESAIPSLRQVVRSADPDQPVTTIRTLEQIVATESSDRASMATLLTLFGAVGLALAVIGVYGVMSYAVAVRTREIAIRMGLGARTGDVRRMILGDGARLTAIGVGLGVAGCWAATRVLTASLEYIESADAMVVAAVVPLLAAVALIACWVPARRAMRVQPMQVLRND